MKSPSSDLSLALSLICVLSLSVGNSFAFSSPVISTSVSALASISASHSSRSHNRVRNESPCRLFSADADEYDYDELRNSEWEQHRLTNMYSKFGGKEWVQHRASDRFYRNVLKFGESPIVKNLLDEAAVLVAICIVIIVWNSAVIDGYTNFDGVHIDAPLADTLPHWIDIKLSLPTEPFFLCGGPLGLLLVFRNDVSFSRYKAAIHHWETVTSSLSNVMLMASIASKNQSAVRDVGLAAWTLGRTLQHELSGFNDPSSTYEKDVRRKNAKVPSSIHDTANLLGARNKLFRAQYDVHTAVEVLSDEISNVDKRALITSVNSVAMACAECEKLYTTPIPLLYTRHTLKFLSLWMTFMPFAFYDVFAGSWNHIFMIPAVSIICFLFFGIEEIAVSLEEPFSILPMDEFVEELALNIDDTTEWMKDGSYRGDDEGIESESRRHEGKIGL